jgi:glycosyltransferase involved in cell wall biosynthesis
LIIACIPAYNEEKTIAKVVLLAQKQVDKVVVCDDGSKDLTADIAQRLGATVIRHRKNLGYGVALQSLFRKAMEMNADVIMTLDADGQHYPEDIPRLIQPILDGETDIVIGSRFLEEHNAVPAYRRLGIKLITKLSSRSKNLSDAQCGFRAYNKKALENLNLNENGMGISAEILLETVKRGLRVVEVPVRVRYKGLDTSTHNSLRHGVNVIMSIVRLVVEERPLRYLGVPGAVFLLMGIFFGMWMLQIFTVSGSIATGIALASIAFTLLGLFTIFTAITLYAIIRLMQKMKTQ